MSSKGSSSYIVFPLAYILLDTLLVLFIKGSSKHGHNTYNSSTANALTECFKLGIALYYVQTDNAWGEFKKINVSMVLKFCVSNLMYAVNNNLFHYCIGALPPALFVVSINALRTLFTSFLQPLVSGKALTKNQIIACGLLTLSFILASMKDITEVIYNNAFKGSSLAYLIFFASLYSSISVSASLVQEKLLKDSCSLMVANVINYSIGIVLQGITILYFSSTSNVPAFRGFSNFWVQMIPVTMALSGLSISFVLRYFDNIVKLLCSSMAVLIVHAVTSYVSEQPIFRFSFLCGWFLTIPATYLYYGTPANTASKPQPKEVVDDKTKSASESSSANSAASGQAKPGNRVFSLYMPICLICALLASARVSNFEWAMSKHYAAFGSGLNTHNQDICPLYQESEVDDQLPSSSATFDAGHSTTRINYASSSLEVNCPLTNVEVLDGNYGFNSAQSKSSIPWRQFSEETANPSSKLRRLFELITGSPPLQKFRGSDRRKLMNGNNWNAISWSALFSNHPDLQSLWVRCRDHGEMSFVVRPVTKTSSSRVEDAAVKDFIATSSKPLSRDGRSSVVGTSPDHDGVLVIYLGSVTASQFKSSYGKTASLLTSLGTDVDRINEFNHVAVKLSKIHSVAPNKDANRQVLLRGSAKVNATTATFPWLFDVAESQGFSVAVGHSSCLGDSVDLGATFNQKGSHSNGYRWPASGCATTIPKFSADSLSSDIHVALNWFKGWLDGTKSVKVDGSTSVRAFGVLVLDNAPSSEIVDASLARFLHYVVTDKKFLKTSIVLLSDDGKHMGRELQRNSDKLSSRLPISYIISSKEYLRPRAQYVETLLHNSQHLLSPYDLRATILHLLTERDFSHNEMGSSQPHLGVDIMTTRINSQRSCASAGIAERYCGCGLEPCIRSVANSVEAHFGDIAEFINDGIALYGAPATSICKPILPSEISFVPGQTIDNCISNYVPTLTEPTLQATRTLVTNVVVSRNNAMLEAFFKVSENGDLKLIYVTTVSSTAPSMWAKCSREFNSQAPNLAETLREDVRQFCFCESVTNYWTGVLLTTMTWFQ